MDVAPKNFGQLRFAAAQLDAKDRIAGWREVLGRKLLRVDVDALGSNPFRADVRLRIFENLRFGSGELGASVNRRSQRHVAHDNDDLLVIVNLSHVLIVNQRGRDLVLRPGDACLISCSEPASYVRKSDGSLRCVRISRALLSHSRPCIDDNLARLIPRESQRLRLLMSYLDAIDREPTYIEKSVRGMIETHVADLIALLFSTDGEVAEHASQRSGRVAQLCAIKDDLARSFTLRSLSLETFARRHNMSARNLQRLFELEGTSFTHQMLSLRVEKAFNLLSDPRLSDRSVGAIASECGFGDVSHFNHVFKRSYGFTPSHIRSKRP